MPHPTTAKSRPGPRRRAVLAGGLALPFAVLLSGCSRTPAASPARPGDAAAEVRRGAARDSADLLARYDTTIDAHPALAARLAPLRAQTARHLRALAEPDTAQPSAAGARPVPPGQQEALAALADAERAAADRRTAALGTAAPDLARLLASVAAAGACHVSLLGGDA